MKNNINKMMPGQEPYTPEELRQLERLIGDAAEGDPGEEFEVDAIEAYAELCRITGATPPPTVP